MDQEANPHRRSGMAMLVVAWALLFGGIFWAFSHWEKRAANPNSAAVLAGQGGTLVLERNRAGHYLAEGEVNGVPVTFLVDTGATWVALSPEQAARLGLRRGAGVRVNTAAGEVEGWRARLDSLRLGTFAAADVGAVVVPGLEDGIALLGMSFLNRVEFAQREGRLVLSPRTASGEKTP